MKKNSLVPALIILASYSFAQDTWTQKADFGGTARAVATGFSVGTKGYIGTGLNPYYFTFSKDFWEYDPVTDAWTQKSDFGGTARYGTTGFSIGTKGYIGLGRDGISSFRKDFWEYDPGTNTWTQKSDFGGDGRYLAVGFSIGNKGYIGTGDTIDNGTGEKNDFWEYDPSSDTWNQKADFPGTEREEAVGFSIGTKGYIGTGDTLDNGMGPTNDFWEYDPSTDAWTQKASFGPGARAAAVGFSIDTKGYIGTGYVSSTYYNDFWEYDPSMDTWTQKANFGGTERTSGVGFSIDKKGFIGTGVDIDIESKNDFWEYDPSSAATLIDEAENSISLSVFPNPAGEFLTVETLQAPADVLFELRDVSGRKILERRLKNETTKIDLHELPKGFYWYYIIDDGEILTRGKLIAQ